MGGHDEASQPSQEACSRVGALRKQPKEKSHEASDGFSIVGSRFGRGEHDGRKRRRLRAGRLSRGLRRSRRRRGGRRRSCCPTCRRCCATAGRCRSAQGLLTHRRKNRAQDMSHRGCADRTPPLRHIGPIGYVGQQLTADSGQDATHTFARCSRAARTFAPSYCRRHRPARCVMPSRSTPQQAMPASGTSTRKRITS